VIDHRVRHVERVVQERPQEPHRDELEGETQPVVITALRHDHVMIRVVQEEEPLKDRLLRRASEPAEHRHLGSGKETTHDRSD
jgi:hypothetical protein